MAFVFELIVSIVSYAQFMMSLSLLSLRFVLSDASYQLPFAMIKISVCFVGI